MERNSPDATVARAINRVLTAERDAADAIAAAWEPLLSAPVSGTFRGNAASSELRAEIDIRVASADAA